MALSRVVALALGLVETPRLFCRPPIVIAVGFPPGRGKRSLFFAAWVQGFVATPLEMGEVAMRGRNQPPTKPTKFAVEFWDQIRAGRDIEEAAKALGASITTCRNWFRHRGGVKPPHSYGRSRRYLTFDEREDIAMYRVQGLGV